VKITPVQRFRDGRTTYEPGKEYDVPDFDGARFVGHGWATSPDYTLPGATPATVDITPDSVAHKATSTKVT
jgi:hypothetical protein